MRLDKLAGKATSFRLIAQLARGAYSQDLPFRRQAPTGKVARVLGDNRECFTGSPSSERSPRPFQQLKLDRHMVVR